MADLEEITDVSNPSKPESKYYDEQILEKEKDDLGIIPLLLTQKSVSPPRTREDTIAQGCHQSCALMKSLSSQSRSNSSEKLSTVKNFNELLQEQRRMLNQYKHEESDDTIAEAQNPEEEGGNCIPEWMIKRSSIISQKSHLKAFESHPDELDHVTLAQDEKCHGDESLVLPERLHTNFEEDKSAGESEVIVDFGDEEPNETECVNVGHLEEDTVMIDGVVSQFMNTFKEPLTNVTHSYQNDSTEECKATQNEEIIDSASNGKLKNTDETDSKLPTESQVFQSNLDASKIIHVENENVRIIENNEVKIDNEMSNVCIGTSETSNVSIGLDPSSIESEPEEPDLKRKSDEKLESVKIFNTEKEKDVHMESEDFDNPSATDVVEHAEVDVMPDNLVPSTKVNIVHEKTEETTTESKIIPESVKHIVKPEVSSAKQRNSEQYKKEQNDTPKKNVEKVKVDNSTEDTFANKKEEEKNERTFEDYDENLESLTKSRVKSQVESQDPVYAVVDDYAKVDILFDDLLSPTKEDKDIKVSSDSSALTTATAVAVGAIAASALVLPALGAGAVAAAASGGSAATAMATATVVGSGVSVGAGVSVGSIAAAAAASTAATAVAVKSLGEAPEVTEEEKAEEPEEENGDAITFCETLVPMVDIQESIEVPPVVQSISLTNVDISADNFEVLSTDGETHDKVVEHCVEVDTSTDSFDAATREEEEVILDVTKKSIMELGAIPEPSKHLNTKDSHIDIDEDEKEKENLKEDFNAQQIERRDSLTNQLMAEDTAQSEDNADAIAVYETLAPVVDIQEYIEAPPTNIFEHVEVDMSTDNFDVLSNHGETHEEVPVSSNGPSLHA